MLQNALLPGHLCLLPGFPGHNALICSTISLLKVGHFDLPLEHYGSSLFALLLQVPPAAGQVSSNSMQLKVESFSLTKKCLQQIGLRSIMKKYYYMDTVWHMFSTRHHIANVPNRHNTHFVTIRAHSHATMPQFSTTSS
jgi:hypothetical protein